MDITRASGALQLNRQTCLHYWNVFRAQAPAGEEAKFGAAIHTWLVRRLSWKGRHEPCATYVFPLILFRLRIISATPRFRIRDETERNIYQWRNIQRGLSGFPRLLSVWPWRRGNGFARLVTLTSGVPSGVPVLVQCRRFDIAHWNKTSCVQSTSHTRAIMCHLCSLSILIFILS